MQGRDSNAQQILKPKRSPLSDFRLTPAIETQQNSKLLSHPDNTVRQPSLETSVKLFAPSG
jgi:hypothetical protein